MTSSIVGTSTVAISSLKPYKGNARRGDVAAIAESLAAHGQYRTVVVNLRTKTILAGHHVVKAAKSLGHTTVTVDWVDVDADTERAIVLADNRLGDLADTNVDLLHDLLTSLPDLDGTLFTQADVDALDDLYGSGAGPMGGGGSSTDMGVVKIGPHRYSDCDIDTMEAWSARMRAQHETKAAAGRAIRDLLGIPAPAPVKRAAPKPTITPDAPGRLQPVEQVPLADLLPFPGNARQGDVGAIAGSLARLGAYRTIVANRRTGHVLVGNHTYAAAQALGWDSLPVHWVDVDDVTETKIVVADNRSSDLATYDADALRALLLDAASGDLTGLGFDGDDIDDILSGGPVKPGPHRARSLTLVVADLSCRVERGLFDTWLHDLPAPVEPVLEDCLHLPRGTLQ